MRVNLLLPIDDWHVREGCHVFPVLYLDAECGLVDCKAPEEVKSLKNPVRFGHEMA